MMQLALRTTGDEAQQYLHNDKIKPQRIGQMQITCRINFITTVL